DEDQVAEVAAAVHPAEERDALAFVGGAQFAVAVRAFQVAEKIELQGSAFLLGISPRVAESMIIKGSFLFFHNPSDSLGTGCGRETRGNSFRADGADGCGSNQTI